MRVHDDFQLRHSEAPVRGIRRITRGVARKVLTGNTEAALPDRVHAARVAAKQLRAYEALLRPVASGAQIDAQRRVLRRATRALSADRDLDVAIRTLRRLAKREDGRARAALDRTARTLASRSGGASRRRRMASSLRDLEAALADFALAFETVDIRARGWAVLAPGFERSDARCRKHLKRWVETERVDAAHAFRRELKQLAFQLQLIEAANPTLIGDRRAELDMLGKRLGRLHDLSNLASRTHTKQLLKRVSAKHLKRVRRIAHRRQEDLARISLPVAIQAFASTPADFIAELGNEWCHWRSAAQPCMRTVRLSRASDAAKVSGA